MTSIERKLSELCGMTVSIYRSDYDCIANLCFGKRSAILVNTEHYNVWEYIAKQKAHNPDAIILKVVHRFIMGRDYYHAEPLDIPKGGTVMHGGTFCECSDSRFPFDYPIAIHDRFETWEQYEHHSK